MPGASQASFPIRAHDKLTTVGSYLRSAVLLLLRLSWGYQLAESGYGHLTHVANTVAFFTDLHVPFPKLSVYVSGGTELVGGSMLMLGLATRLISLPVIFNFIVAFATASKENVLKLFHHPTTDNWDAIVNDTAFPMLVLGLVMFAFGPGRVSLDFLLHRLFLHKSPEGPGFPVKET